MIIYLFIIATKLIKVAIVIIMALFRSDVINKEFIEKVLRKNEVKNIGISFSNSKSTS